MSEENAPKAKDTIKLDVETILQTTEGRDFLNQLNTVSRVLSISNSEVEFKGEEILKTGYIGDCKSVMLFKCPKGYFLFCDRSFTKNNWSAVSETTNDLVAKIHDKEIKNKIAETLTAQSST